MIDIEKALIEATAGGAPGPTVLGTAERNLLMQVAENGGELLSRYVGAGRWELPNGKRYAAAVFKALERKGMVDNGYNADHPTRLTIAGERWVALYPKISGTAARRALLYDVMMGRVHAERCSTLEPVSMWLRAENVTAKIRKLADVGLVEVPALDYGGGLVTITLAGQYAYRLWRGIR